MAERYLVAKVKVRPDPDGKFDELLAEQVWLHAEMMDDDTLWIGIYQDEPGREDRVVMWVTIEDGHLRITAEKD